MSLFVLLSCRAADPEPGRPGAASTSSVSSPPASQAAAGPRETPAPTLSIWPAAPAPTVSSPVSRISAVPPGRLTHSWREGCPVGPADLRLLSVPYWGFDSRPHSGELVVHRDQASRISSVMKTLYEDRFPIERMELVDRYQADDDRSMEANNTSAFNCRTIESRPEFWSEHAYGRALDINPVQNPYVSAAGEVSPAAGAAYADRSLRRKGMIRSGELVVRAFQSAGWKWGGHWSGAKDYQHFSATGR